MFDLLNYDNWYWEIKDNASQVYSTASRSLVSNTDAAYVAWKKAGNLPSRIANKAELDDHLEYAAPSKLEDGARRDEAIIPIKQKIENLEAEVETKADKVIETAKKL